MQLPAIDAPLLLDLLFGVVILLFVPFGIRRGVAKEGFVSAALLLSARIAERWAEPWSRWLADGFGVDPGIGRFAVTAGILGAGLLLLGYGAGAALGRMQVGVPGRLAGGLLAAINGAFLLALLLAAIERDLRPAAALSASFVGGELLRDLDRLLLGAAGVLLLCTVAGWVVRAIRGERALPPEQWAGAAVPPRQRPVRVARDTEAGKYEPEATGRPSVALGETAPLPPAFDDVRWRPSPTASNGNQAGATGSWATRAGDGGDATWRPWQDPSLGRTVEVAPSGSGDAGRRFGDSGPFRTAGGDDRGRCPTCGSAVAPSDLFCPSCGKTL